MDINIKSLTTVEQLRAMELLWDELCHRISDIPSPDWHEALLKKREEQLRVGNDRFIDWEDAKTELTAFHENRNS